MSDVEKLLLHELILMGSRLYNIKPTSNRSNTTYIFNDKISDMFRLK